MWKNLPGIRGRSPSQATVHSRQWNFTHIYEHLHEEGSGVDWLKKILKIPVHVQHNMREKNGHFVYYSQELLPDVNLITLRVNICHKNILAIT